VAVLLAFASLSLGARAWAGATDPTLVIGEVVARPVGSGALAEVTGIYGFDDLVQMNYPITLVAYTGTNFVRLRPSAQAASGSFAGLSDGLAAGELASFEATGTSDPSASFVRIEPNKLTVALPSALSSGNVSFVAYIVIPGEGTFFTNVVTVNIQGGTP
jgi:hypothetical protein